MSARPWFLLHRWLGRAVGLLVLLWFVSGAVMVRVGFPRLTAVERCAGSPVLPVYGWTVGPGAAFRATGLPGLPARVRLGSFLDRPVYHFQPYPGRRWSTVFADTGRCLAEVAPEQAATVAAGFQAALHPRPGPLDSHARFPIQVVPLELDQWSVSTPLDPYRPLYRVTFADPAGTELYVSRRTGEVVRDTTRRERLWNYAGAVTHWIYPAFLRRHVVLWRTIGRVLSGAGLILATAGCVLVVVRWRTALRSFRGWRRLHFLAGAAFGLLGVTWLFSGFFSFRITALFDSGEPTLAQVTAFDGGPLNPQQFNRSITELIKSLPPGFAACEGELFLTEAGPMVQFRSVPGATLLVTAPSDQPVSVFSRLDPAVIQRAAPRLLPGASLREVRCLAEPDPCLGADSVGWIRVGFADAEATDFYIDPADGRIASRLTRRSRAYRWLFDGLHRFDWPVLREHTVLREILVWGALAGGTMLAASGLWLAWWRPGHRSISGSRGSSSVPGIQGVATAGTSAGVSVVE